MMLVTLKMFFFFKFSTRLKPQNKKTIQNRLKNE